MLGREARYSAWRELVIGGTPWIIVDRLIDEDVWVERIKHAAQEWPENL